ncbi:DUF6011 domain-containing protein [Bacillus sp. JCM 19041]|uniref:DUF6011 domain-containing protein n=1 Tax=Bacillus sp. JCM 19041 TaxID=1460637 RepID=UPI00336A7033
MSALWNRRVLTLDEYLYTHCKRCLRKLKSEESQKRGYGRVCADKVGYMQSMDLIELLTEETDVNHTA